MTSGIVAIEFFIFFEGLYDVVIDSIDTSFTAQTPYNWRAFMLDLVELRDQFIKLTLKGLHQAIESLRWLSRIVDQFANLTGINKPFVLSEGRTA